MAKRTKRKTRRPATREATPADRRQQAATNAQADRDALEAILAAPTEWLRRVTLEHPDTTEREALAALHKRKSQLDKKLVSQPVGKMTARLAPGGAAGPIPSRGSALPDRRDTRAAAQ